MARAAILLADGFETAEALVTADILRRAGVHGGLVSAMGMTHLISGQQIQLLADTTVEGLEAKDLDGIVVPGGMPAVKRLEENPAVRTLLADALGNGHTLVAAICAGPVLLARVGLPAGARLTVSPSYRAEIPAEFLVDEDVVVDEQLVTARSMDCAFAFALAVAERIGGPDARRRALSSMGRTDSPVSGKVEP